MLNRYTTGPKIQQQENYNTPIKANQHFFSRFIYYQIFAVKASNLLKFQKKKRSIFKERF
jgi:hypothetical protein